MEARARRSWSALRSRSVSWSSQHELAASVGSTREAVAKALRLLRDQGLVRTGPGTLAVADLDPLRLLAAGQPHGTQT